MSSELARRETDDQGLVMTNQPIDVQMRFRGLGRIRLGAKGAKGQPQKLESFRLTSASKTLLDAAAKVYGGTVQEWTDAPDKGMWELFTESNELDILLPPTLDNNGRPSVPYSSYYELWSAGGCQRRCDGQTELLSDKPCMCDPEDRECDITTRASVMLPKIPSLGVWRFDTKSYYAASELPGTLNLLASLASRGQLAPAILRIENRSAKRKVDGKVQTRRFIVPVIDLPGLTLAEVAPELMSFNAPALPPQGKPELGGNADLPHEAAFEESPSLGDRPPIGSDDGGLFPTDGEGAPPPEQEVGHQVDIDKLRKRIFAQFRDLKIGTSERKTLVTEIYSLDSFKDLDVDQMQHLTEWLANASRADVDEVLAQAEGTA